MIFFSPTQLEQPPTARAQKGECMHESVGTTASRRVRDHGRCPCKRNAQCAHIVHVSSFKLIKGYTRMVIAVLFVLCTAFAAAVATLGFTTAFTPTAILHATARSAVTLRRRTSSLSGDVLSPLVNLLQDEESDADVRGSSSVRELIL